MPSVPVRLRSRPSDGEPRWPPAATDGSLLRCYECSGVATVEIQVFFDAEARDQWPVLPCPLTPGCPGHLVPEALN